METKTELVANARKTETGPGRRRASGDSSAISDDARELAEILSERRRELEALFAS